MYPGDNPPLEASAWAGWPVEWSTPNTAALGLSGRALADIVWACIDLNARIVADMPGYVTKGLQPQTPPPSWLRNPEPLVYSHWGEFMKQVWFAFQAVGEAFIICTSRYADTGYPRTFMMLDPAYVGVELVGGLRRYSIAGEDATLDVLHIRYASWPSDPNGHGPLEVAGERLLAAQTFMRYASDLAQNGGVPWAVLKSKYRLGKAQAQLLKSQWIESARNRLGAPAILDSETDLQVLQVPPKDMALSDLQSFTEARIATLLGVPAYLVSLPSGADPMTYSNVSSLFDYHWRATLRPLSRFITRAMSEWALPNGTDLELDPDSYIRPSPQDRANTYKVMVEMGAMTIAEVRKAERLGSIEEESYSDSVV
jgi:HK97 family phage portal protein